MLRDLCRLLGASHRLTLVDERSEIAAVHHGVPQYDVGLHTDVLDGFPRAEGLLTALRVMTPEVLVCDEIGTEADAQAILGIHGCGVPVIASATEHHGRTWNAVRCCGSCWNRVCSAMRRFCLCRNKALSGHCGR